MLYRYKYINKYRILPINITILSKFYFIIQKLRIKTMNNQLFEIKLTRI